jgi:hypothetical protein
MCGFDALIEVFLTLKLVVAIPPIAETIIVCFPAGQIVCVAWLHTAKGWISGIFVASLKEARMIYSCRRCHVWFVNFT